MTHYPQIPALDSAEDILFNMEVSAREEPKQLGSQM
jgi:hypothetical protein